MMIITTSCEGACSNSRRSVYSNRSGLYGVHVTAWSGRTVVMQAIRQEGPQRDENTAHSWEAAKVWYPLFALKHEVWKNLPHKNTPARSTCLVDLSCWTIRVILLPRCFRTPLGGGSKSFPSVMEQHKKSLPVFTSHRSDEFSYALCPQKNLAEELCSRSCFSKVYNKTSDWKQHLLCVKPFLE